MRNSNFCKDVRIVGETNPNAKFTIDRGIVISPARNVNDETSNNTHAHDKEKWQPNTTLIVGDSILNGIIERKISKTYYPVKVRVFPGAKISDMYHYLVPLFRKNPTNIIFHCGTNDTLIKSPEEIAEEIVELKYFIEENLALSRVIISYPTIRNDNYIASSKVSKFRSYLQDLNYESISHYNINSDCLGKGKLQCL